jgi:hypothetical protein
VYQDQPLQNLLDFATANTETQGKFTIGDEKVGTEFQRERSDMAETQSFHANQRMLAAHQPQANLEQEMALQSAVEESTPLGTMAKLRELKNRF